MNKKNILTPVRKILRTISSCQNEEEIEDCRVLVQNYLKSAKNNKIVNLNDLKERLDEQLMQRQEELYLVRIFNK